MSYKTDNEQYISKQHCDQDMDFIEQCDTDANAIDDEK